MATPQEKALAVHSIGEAWAEKEDLGPCGVVACYINELLDYSLVLGGHTEFGPGDPTHFWNIDDDHRYRDFSLYPDGIIPYEDLSNYTYEELRFDTCKKAVGDVFTSPTDNPEKEWIKAKYFFDDMMRSIMPAEVGRRRRKELRSRRAGGCPSGRC